MHQKISSFEFIEDLIKSQKLRRKNRKQEAKSDRDEDGQG
jgi:hypothetical protein